MQQNRSDKKSILDLKYTYNKNKSNRISLIVYKNHFTLFFDGNEVIKSYFLAKEIKPYFLEPLLEAINKNHNLNLKPYSTVMIDGLEKSFLTGLFSNFDLRTKGLIEIDSYLYNESAL